MTDTTVDLLAELTAMDFMGGCSGRSVQAAEALWPDHAPIPWRDAYEIAQLRAKDEAHDQDGGRTVAFLEATLATMRAVAVEGRCPNCGSGGPAGSVCKAHDVPPANPSWKGPVRESLRLWAVAHQDPTSDEFGVVLAWNEDEAIELGAAAGNVTPDVLGARALPTSGEARAVIWGTSEHRDVNVLMRGLLGC